MASSAVVECGERDAPVREAREVVGLGGGRERRRRERERRRRARGEPPRREWRVAVRAARGAGAASSGADRRRAAGGGEAGGGAAAVLARGAVGRDWGRARERAAVHCGRDRRWHGHRGRLLLWWRGGIGCEHRPPAGAVSRPARGVGREYGPPRRAVLRPARRAGNCARRGWRAWLLKRPGLLALRRFWRPWRPGLGRAARLAALVTAR